MSEYRELLLGCGNNREKRIRQGGRPGEWQSLTTLDIDPGVKPDIVHDLNVMPLPFADNAFDEVHAYECLEHTGTQGDWRFFFAQFEELWRILKPDGLLCVTVPMWDSPWAWGDPGHTRVIPRQSLIFLSQANYAAEVGTTSLTDYRPWFKGDFEFVTFNEGEHQFGFILKALKATP